MTQVTKTPRKAVNYFESTIANKRTVFIKYNYIDEYGITKTQSGSGFMIGQNTVLTAGHNLYDKDKFYGDNGSHWSFNVEVMPSRYKNNNGDFVDPYGTAYAFRARCSAEWMNTRNDDEDWGILELKTNVGKMTGYLDVSYKSGGYAFGTEITVNGYPKEVLKKDVLGIQYTRTGTTGQCDEKTFISYDAYVSPGESGGPCLIGSEETGYSVIGIVIGFELSPTTNYQTFSKYRRIDKSLYDELIKYKNSTL